MLERQAERREEMLVEIRLVEKRLVEKRLDETRLDKKEVKRWVWWLEKK